MTGEAAATLAFLAEIGTPRSVIASVKRQLQPACKPCVYFIGGPFGPIKIGRTDQLAKRLGDLQTGSPLLLRVYGTTPGGSRLEQAIHRKLAAHRLHGEWFERGPALALCSEIATLETS